MTDKKFKLGDKKEGYELLKPGRDFIGPRVFKRAKDVKITAGDKKGTLKNINKNSYVPKKLIPDNFDMSCFEDQPDAKKTSKK